MLLFTDICDSTALKSQHGAIECKEVAELHNRLFESLAAEEKLTLIKNTGDGYFARSTSVAAVARFALRFQYGMRTIGWPGFPITTRVGVLAGEVADITTLGQDTPYLSILRRFVSEYVRCVQYPLRAFSGHAVIPVVSGRRSILWPARCPQ